MKLHLGCGKRFIEGYTHVDLAEFEHIDHQTSVTELGMFEDQSVKEIYASHVIEYFDLVEVRDVLFEWHRVLKFGGELILSVPNFEALIKIYQTTDDIKTILGPLFGLMPQNSNIISHKIVYTRKLLLETLGQSGFSEFSDWNTFEKFPDFDDHSKAFFPKMDFKGCQVSLNISCKKIK